MNLTPCESITLLILEGNTQQAQQEIAASVELARITGRAPTLNSLQVRDLSAAIVEANIQRPYIAPDLHCS